jgi:hypothetical protein
VEASTLTLAPRSVTLLAETSRPRVAAIAEPPHTTP